MAVVWQNSILNLGKNGMMSKFTKICPHSDCSKAFFAPFYQRGIYFCPHCQRSLLRVKHDPDRQILANNPTISLGKFFLLYLKAHPVFAVLTFISIVLSTFVILFPHDKNYRQVVAFFAPFALSAETLIWAFMAILTGFLCLAIFSFIKQRTGYHHYLAGFSLSKAPLVAGVDTVKVVRADDMPYFFNQNNGVASCTCQQCGSQRLVTYARLTTGRLYQLDNSVLAQASRESIEKDSNFVVCQNCHKVNVMNPKLSKMVSENQGINYVINLGFYMLMVFCKAYVNIWLFIALFLFTSLFTQAYFAYRKAKQPIWQASI